MKMLHTPIGLWMVVGSAYMTDASVFQVSGGLSRDQLGAITCGDGLGEAPA